MAFKGKAAPPKCRVRGLFSPLVYKNVSMTLQLK